MKRPSPPTFYNTDIIDKIYMVRSALIAEEADRYRRANGISPASQDRFRIAAFGIDCQLDFCHPEGSLFVPGAVEDTRRAVEWIYTNLDRLSGLHFSMDTHRVFQIFHPAWWVDAEGRHPDPFTPITYADLKAGRWAPMAHPKACLEYCKKLEATGKYVLNIWPYHTLLGGIGHALVPALMEAAVFHSLVRLHQTHFETKGTHAMTESYSVLSPEVEELGGQMVGSFNTSFFKLLMEYDRIYIFGQAKSHCVLSTIKDLQEQIESVDRNLARKVWILEDAMSPVPAPDLDPLPPALNFPAVADREFEAFRKGGMNLVKTTDAIVFD